ncbi:MAG: type II/IV secretion system protein [Deltaproteobacteria bacterium]|nr:type II/IV secretion system protein [Deltaproteobacteria bacterium]
MEIETRIEEAAVYHSMGLFSESLDVYKEILSCVSDLERDRREEIDGKIAIIEKEIEEHSRGVGCTFSDEDITCIHDTLAVVNNNAPAIHDSAFAFKELGLMKEAVVEYEKLLTLDYSRETLIPEMSECLFKLYPMTQIIGQVEEMIKRHDFEDEKKANLKFRFGLEMEKRDNKELALYFYETAAGLDPKNREIKERLNFVAAFFATGSKYDHLLMNKLITTDQLQETLDLAKKTKKSVEYVLINHLKLKKEDVGKSLSNCFGCPFKGFDPDTKTPVELLGNLKKLFLLQDLWVPLGWEKDRIQVLVDDPINLNKIDIIKALLKAKNIELFVGIKEDIETYIKLFFKDGPSAERDSTGEEIEDLDILPDISFEEEEDDQEDIPEEYNEASGKIVRLVDQILVAAFRKNTSDIHIEPSPVTKKTMVRFRMDGVCQEYIQIPNSMAKGIISRIKIMAGLDISERRLPQDGKIKFKRKGIPPFELRVATLPTAGDFEDAVLRILATAGAMALDDMGLNERNLKIMKEIISQPYGLILVVGPTGSGKTTSLHAALGHINKPGIKIWTAEDPIEITQQGMRQVEAKPKIGLDFSRIMRAFLRADPDVIMIGEMRDHETASIGVEASLTGHLVFSTLHTNSAPETVTRLLDMGLNPLNFSDAFLGVMAQRLVRKLCSACREEYHPSEEEFNEIVSDYGEEYFRNTGIEYSPGLTLFRSVGCDLCSATGYKGRLGIHELMKGTKKIKNMIKKKEPSDELFKQAMTEGMSTLKQDGIVKAFKGMTDISEIRRVCIS